MLQKAPCRETRRFSYVHQTKQTVSWHSKHKALRPETDVAPDINQVIISKDYSAKRFQSAHSTNTNLPGATTL
ncbi:hypothetical protein, partial [Muribaculum intestinale]|uniref:hypothetical protein n=1 Tax=Muribaculum intestinale TaxID=1796646 RepID=UPI00272CF3FE